LRTAGYSSPEGTYSGCWTPSDTCVRRAAESGGQLEVSQRCTFGQREVRSHDEGGDRMGQQLFVAETVAG